MVVAVAALVASAMHGCGNPAGPNDVDEAGAGGVALVGRALRPLAEMPNVLLVTLDTTRADHLGCYGYSRRTSPRLDALAGEGAIFLHAQAQASVTPVSHASIFTGLFPYEHGLRCLHGAWSTELGEEVPTLAEVLREQGYRTGAFISAFPAGAAFGLDRGFEVFDEDFDGDAERTGSGIVSTGAAQRTAAETNRRAFAWLDGLAAGASAVGEASEAAESSESRGPFLLWAHYFDPHDLELVPEDASFLERFPAEAGDPKSPFIAKYDGEILYMDEHFGALVDRVRQEERPTVILVVGDHGEGLGQHDWWGHGILYQEQIRVPLILAGPGVAAGARVESLVRTVDVLPTILAAVGIELHGDEPLDGVDLGPLARGETDDLALASYADSLNMLGYRVPWSDEVVDEKRDQLFALTEGRWKYIHYRLGSSPDELYDLETDPRETVNLAGSRPELAQRMKQDLLDRGILRARIGTEGAIDPREVERLKALGYIPFEDSSAGGSPESREGAESSGGR